MFDIFVAVLNLDCVVTYDTIYLKLVCTEMCKQIHNLRQYFKDKYGHFFQSSPDELFRQYMSLIPDLPDDTTG